MPTDRITILANEVDRLRKSRHLADNQLQELMLKITEVQLNLAQQDKTLSKLEAAIFGIADKPGLLTRIDRTERVCNNLTKTVWILIAASISVLLKILFEHH